MDKKKVIIASLFASSLILLTLLTVVHLFVSPQIVIAGSMQDRGGDYIATVSSVSSDEDVLWVLDCRTKTAGIYQYDPGSRMLELRTSLTVRQLGE